MPEEAVRRLRQRDARYRDLHQGGAGRRAGGGAGGGAGHDRGGRAVVERLVNERAAVGLEPREREEQIPGLECPGVGADTPDPGASAGERWPSSESP